MNGVMQKNDIVNFTNGWISRLLILACLCELAFFYSPANLYGCLSLLYGWFLVAFFVFKREFILRYPLPTIAVFSLGIYYYFLPIVVTLLEGKPLTFNFQVPFLTFTNQIISITVIVLSFRIAIKLYRPGCLLNRLWNKVGYMSVLNEKQIWIMGCIGLLCLLSMVASQGQDREFQGTGNTMEIITQSLSLFSLSPICLYFKSLYGDRTQTHSKSFVKYYIIILVVVGMASTRRTLIFNSVFTIMLIYFFLVLYKNKKIMSGKNFIICLAVFYLAFGPIADLAAAMILNRQSVYSSSAGNTLESVWQLYNDKERLRTTYDFFMASLGNGGDNSNGWSEYYVNNIFLDRFCNLRTIDGTLYNAQKAGFGCYEGSKYYESYWITQLPSFMANMLDLKKDFQGTAVDHMVVSNFAGNRYSLFGFKVGGETGIGLWMFGYLYYFLAFFTYIVVFYFLCSFVNIKGATLIIPLPILVTFRLFWMYFINANGIFTSMDFSFSRNNLNTILIYCVVIFFLKKITVKNGINRIY